MCKKTVILAIMALLALVSCRPRTSAAGPDAAETRVPELLASVPSDALAVICYDRCTEGMKMLDSTSVLHQLDLSRLKGTGMSLSLCFNGSLVPSLSIDASGIGTDSATVVNSLLAQAKELGLLSSYYPSDSASVRHGMVVITTSDVELEAIRRHISEGRSIMDAPDFDKALAAAGGSGKFIIRNEGAERLIPRQFLSGIFSHRDVSEFLHTAAEWTIINKEGENVYNIQTVEGKSNSFYVNAIGSIPCSESKIGSVLPADTRFSIALVTPAPHFRGAYENYLDASVKLTEYTRHNSALGRTTGTNPLEWEKELNVKEVALVCMGVSSVVLVRPSRAVPDKEPGQNEFRGFPAALYGSAFSLQDDSEVASRNGWYVFGSSAAVQNFLGSKVATGTKIQGKNCHLIIYEPENTLVWSKNGMKLWSSGQ